jgi:hypothetical protein
MAASSSFGISLETGLKAIRVVSEAWELYEHFTSQSEGVIHRADLIMRGVMLALQLSEASAKDPDPLKNLELQKHCKNFEWNARLASFPVGYAQVIANEVERNPNGKLLTESKETLAAHFISNIRAGVEGIIIQEQIYQVLPSHELEKERRPVYEEPPPSLVDHFPIPIQTGTKPVDLQESREILQSSQKLCNILTIIEIVARFKLVSRIGKIVEDFRNPAPIPADPALAAARLQEAAQPLPQEPRNPIDLVARNSIPLFLHDDPVLRLRRCAITQLPIRHVLRDPRDQSLYERRAILTWLQNHRTSPRGNWPLTADALQECPDIQDTIDQRLVILSERLREAAVQFMGEEE